MNFVIVGEMVSKSSNEFKNTNTNIDWYRIKDLRNLVAHDYFELILKKFGKLLRAICPSWKMIF